jgi:hypothetical protein
MWRVTGEQKPLLCFQINQQQPLPEPFKPSAVRQWLEKLQRRCVVHDNVQEGNRERAWWEVWGGMMVAEVEVVVMEVVVVEVVVSATKTLIMSFACDVVTWSCSPVRQTGPHPCIHLEKLSQAEAAAQQANDEYITSSWS